MDILVKPIVTEKLTAQAEKLNRYGFVVGMTANKLQIKKAVEDLYKVKVTAVNTMRYAGKAKSRFTKSGVINGKAGNTKRAVITVAKGETIDFYSNI
jgi:large subunit ribosomal protein L23